VSLHLQAWEGRVIRGDPAVAGHMLQATGTRNGVRSSVNFTTDKVVGNGSFGVVYAATCLETGETVSSPSLLRAISAAILGESANSRSNLHASSW
jgi:hypothetical protein